MKYDYLIYAAVIAIAVAFNLWWFAFAPCEWIFKVSWALKNIPVHCLVK